jgi:hypothetical protein
LQAPCWQSRRNYIVLVAYTHGGAAGMTALGGDV